MAEDTIRNSDPEIKKLENYLERRITILLIVGTVGFLLTVVASALVFRDIKISLDRHIFIIATAKNPGLTLTYLIFRTSALGAIATTAIYFGIRITISSYDQAMRFTKRKMGTLFLTYLYQKHHEQLKVGEVDLGKIMGSFEIWNKTVESAFSRAKPEKPEDLSDKYFPNPFRRRRKPE